MSDSEIHCPWCSAPLPDATVDKCPSCGATLVTAGGTEPVLPGVTQLDPEAILRARSDGIRPRNRLLSFLAGDQDPDPGEQGSAESLAPPPDDVRREMLRLELEAEQASADAERIALKSDVLEQRGIHLNDLVGAPDDEPGETPGEADGEDKGEAEGKKPAG